MSETHYVMQEHIAMSETHYVIQEHIAMAEIHYVVQGHIAMSELTMWCKTTEQCLRLTMLHSFRVLYFAPPQTQE